MPRVWMRSPGPLCWTVRTASACITSKLLCRCFPSPDACMLTRYACLRPQLVGLACTFDLGKLWDLYGKVGGGYSQVLSCRAHRATCIQQAIIRIPRSALDMPFIAMLDGEPLGSSGGDMPGSSRSGCDGASLGPAATGLDARGGYHLGVASTPLALATVFAHLRAVSVPRRRPPARSRLTPGEGRATRASRARWGRRRRARRSAKVCQVGRR